MNQNPPIIRLDTVDSTSTYIMDRPALWKSQFCAVVAREQTGGRGRSGRTWSSGPGLDLTFSMVFIPPVGAADSSCVTLLAGLAVYRALSGCCGLDLNLKWPNDIRFGDKKIGGILCEMVQSPEITAVIIGIGINVNRTAFPEEIAATAASLKTATGSDHSVEAIFIDIHRHCMELLSAFRVPLDEGLIAEWTSASNSIGVPVRFARHDRVEEGILSGINRDGSINIISVSGDLIEGFRGEILFPDDE